MYIFGLVALSLLLTLPPLAQAETFHPTGPVPSPQTKVRTIQQSLDAIATETTRIKNRPTDPPSTAGGAGITGPLGRTCAEARERMRWSDLPCSPFMPEK